MPEQPFHIDPERLWPANRDYIERIEREGIDIIYDSALDALFVEFGGPREALSEHAFDNVMVRVDPESLHIVGFEILNFFSDFLPHNRLIQEFVRDTDLTKDRDAQITLREPRLIDAIEALIPSMAQAVGSGT